MVESSRQFIDTHAYELDQLVQGSAALGEIALAFCQVEVPIEGGTSTGEFRYRSPADSEEWNVVPLDEETLHPLSNLSEQDPLRQEANLLVRSIFNLTSRVRGGSPGVSTVHLPNLDLVTSATAACHAGRYRSRDHQFQAEVRYTSVGGIQAGRSTHDAQSASLLKIDDTFASDVRIDMTGKDDTARILGVEAWVNYKDLEQMVGPLATIETDPDIPDDVRVILLHRLMRSMEGNEQARQDLRRLRHHSALKEHQVEFIDDILGRPPLPAMTEGRLAADLPLFRDALELWGRDSGDD